MILIGNKLNLIEEGICERKVAEDEAKQEWEKYDMIWGGELSIERLTRQDLIKLFEKYTGEIYKRIGEKKSERQSIKRLVKHKKKEKKLFSCFKK